MLTLRPAGSTRITASPGQNARLSIRHLSIVLFATAILMMAWHLCQYLPYAFAAIRYPFELDYGEGIVWQQALLIPGHRMYGDINQFPFLVFHYPPLYHLVVRGIAALGFDFLASGRAVSVACTLAIGALAAAISFHAAHETTSRIAALAGAAVAGLGVFCYWPVVLWSPLLRVDMLAVALSLLGVWWMVRSPGHPGRLYLAVVAFVLAVYTKQTCIAAPLATLPIMLIVDRTHGIKAALLGLLLGLAALALLEGLTHGNFLRHILLYNLNRYSLRTALVMIAQEWPHLGFLSLAMAAVCVVQRRLAVRGAWTSLAAFRQEMRANPDSLTLAILMLYFGISTARLVMLGKSGGALNYIIEWMCVWSVLIGTLTATIVDKACGNRPGSRHIMGQLALLLVPALLICQVATMPAAASQIYGIHDRNRNEQLDRLLAGVTHANRPVLSDDMVLLMKAGKTVPWEPAIFAELASTGRWDERQVIDMIAAHDFAFIITMGHPGEPMYDSRFDPGVSQAIEAAYPDAQICASRIVHLPANQSGPATAAGCASGDRQRISATQE